MPDQQITLSVSAAIAGLGSISQNSLWQGAVSGLEASANQLGLGDRSFEIPLPDWVDLLSAAKEELEGKVQELQDLLDAQPPGTAPGAGPGLPALAPVDPLAPLQRLAEAINAAEQRLNLQNLVIASGSVEVNLSVKVGDLAGAQATVKLDIQPRPFA